MHNPKWHSNSNRARRSFILPDFIFTTSHPLQQTRRNLTDNAFWYAIADFLLFSSSFSLLFFLLFILLLIICGSGRPSACTCHMSRKSAHSTKILLTFRSPFFFSQVRQNEIVAIFTGSQPLLVIW